MLKNPLPYETASITSQRVANLHRSSVVRFYKLQTTISICSHCIIQGTSKPTDLYTKRYALQLRLEAIEFRDLVPRSNQILCHHLNCTLQGEYLTCKTHKSTLDMDIHVPQYAIGLHQDSSDFETQRPSQTTRLLRSHRSKTYF
jgi:hypothetical protein